MVTLTNTLSGRYFSSTIPDVSFTIAGYRAAVTITVDGRQVYSEHLYPLAGAISLRNLSGLITPYARRDLAIALSIKITEQFSDSATENTATMSASVVYCDADLDTTADDFLSKHFLSILLGEKVTALGRLEYLHYIGTDAATVTATYADGTTAAYPAVQVGGNGKYTTIDVSPSRFVKAGALLTEYRVTAGARTQVYTIDLEQPDCAPILLFVNCFGVEEVLYCTGTATLSPTYKRDTAYMDGLLKNYYIEETRTFKADTGVLTFAMADWAQELFRSQYVRVMNIYDGNPVVGKEVVLTDAKAEYTNDDDELPRLTFSYQYAQRNHNVVQLQRAGRIFDNTFDQTFN